MQSKKLAMVAASFFVKMDSLLGEQKLCLLIWDGH